jgi:hypothetical protein
VNWNESYWADFTTEAKAVAIAMSEKANDINRTSPCHKCIKSFTAGYFNSPV